MAKKEQAQASAGAGTIPAGTMAGAGAPSSKKTRASKQASAGAKNSAGAGTMASKKQEQELENFAQAIETLNKKSIAYINYSFKYKNGMTADDINLNSIEQLLFNYWSKKFQQKEYRDTISNLSKNLGTYATAGAGTMAKKELLRAHFDDDSIKKVLLKIHLLELDVKNNHSLFISMNKNNEIYYKFIAYDKTLIQEQKKRAQKELTAQEQASRQELEQRKQEFKKVSSSKFDDVTSNATAGAGAIASLYNAMDDDVKNATRIQTLEQFYNAQDNKKLLEDGAPAYCVMKTKEFKRLKNIEKSYQEILRAQAPKKTRASKQASAGAPIEQAKKSIEQKMEKMTATIEELKELAK